MPQTLALKDLSLDQIRLEASSRLDPERKSALGQFMTPASVAHFMASLFRKWPSQVELLDPGAGSGCLSAAFTTEFQKHATRDASLSITAYEIDSVLIEYLSEQLRQFKANGKRFGHQVSLEILSRDFIKEGALQLSFGAAPFSHVILNPPYKKISSSSDYRLLLREVGIETVNLYTAFLALAVGLTKPGGEIVAIIPRSFCNGMYYRPFRKWLLERVAIRHVHIFESRKKAFRDDDVLQENIIIKLERLGAPSSVIISTSEDASFHNYQERTVQLEEVIKPSDTEFFIYLPTHELEVHSNLFCHSFSELGLEVATGPIVDFRMREHWLENPVGKFAPLLYAHHFAGGQFQWPRIHKKPNAVKLNVASMKWLMPKGWYTITKRFSAKEERRRLVAFVVDPNALPHDFYGFENHLNVIHAGKKGISRELARGIAVFLNSTAADRAFRIFSGHTQVNATDLRAMLFPTKATLVKFGKWLAEHQTASQEELDKFVESHGH
jgi:adenine-specific DNA-methyltransferase